MGGEILNEMWEEEQLKRIGNDLSKLDYWILIALKNMVDKELDKRDAGFDLQQKDSQIPSG